MNSWHVGVAAEAMVAAQFARYGYDVSVQYGADQPEYDLIASRGDEMLKISVKGSKDGGWGLTQSFKKGRTYHEAIDEWLNKHHKKTIFCLIQFENVNDLQLPKMYLATPSEIAEVLRNERNGLGDTILYMEQRGVQLRRHMERRIKSRKSGFSREIELIRYLKCTEDNLKSLRRENYAKRTYTASLHTTVYFA